MRLKNINSGYVFPATIFKHGNMPDYFNTSPERLEVELNGRMIDMVLRPGHPESNRVSFKSTTEEHVWHFIDNESLWNEISQSITVRMNHERLSYVTTNASRSRTPTRSLKKTKAEYEVGSCTCNREMSFSAFGDLDNACAEKVNCDNDAFPYNSAYLPNPIFSESPKVCLIGLEPSDRTISPFTFEEMLEMNFKNFMMDEAYLIMHYCATQIFGTDYAITDFSKGAMPPGDIARRHRTARFQRWLPILKAERLLLGNPPMIALGRDSFAYLMRFGIEPRYKVGHPSPSSNGYFRKNGEPLSATMPKLVKFIEFAETLLSDQDIEMKLRYAILNGLFVEEKQTQRDRYFYYIDHFKKILDEIQKI